ncbi:hypothetical protein E4U44_000285 [Claviceps purpurea]|nr:hypothetical protein E4U44_000285 [Claviceps purpurea]
MSLLLLRRPHMARHTIICIDINITDTVVSKPDKTSPWETRPCPSVVAATVHMGINTATAA